MGSLARLCWHACDIHSHCLQHMMVVILRRKRSSESDPEGLSMTQEHHETSATPFRHEMHWAGPKLHSGLCWDSWPFIGLGYTTSSVHSLLFRGDVSSTTS